MVCMVKMLGLPRTREGCPHIFRLAVNSARVCVELVVISCALTPPETHSDFSLPESCFDVLAGLRLARGRNRPGRSPRQEAAQP